MKKKDFSQNKKRNMGINNVGTRWLINSKLYILYNT